MTPCSNPHCSNVNRSLAMMMCPTCHARAVAAIKARGTLPVGKQSCSEEYEARPYCGRDNSIPNLMSYAVKRRINRKGSTQS